VSEDKPSIELLERAKAEAIRRYQELRAVNHHHRSFDAQQALEEVNAKFNLGGLGVEGDCRGNGEGHITIQYINMGDTYDMTIVFYQDEFLVTSWGNIVEEHQDEEE
jgi:hypothetical protein